MIQIDTMSQKYEKLFLNNICVIELKRVVFECQQFSCLDLTIVEKADNEEILPCTSLLNSIADKCVRRRTNFLIIKLEIAKLADWVILLYLFF